VECCEAPPLALKPVAVGGREAGRSAAPPLELRPVAVAGRISGSGSSMNAGERALRYRSEAGDSTPPACRMAAACAAGEAALPSHDAPPPALARETSGDVGGMDTSPAAAMSAVAPPSKSSP
jgi:hypothetical protein